MADEAAVVPGAVLGTTSDFSSGRGTYVIDNVIYSSVLGFKRTIKSQDGGSEVSVQCLRPDAEVPAIGNVVLCRVSKINMRAAYVDVLMVENSDAFRQPIPGVIKARDIRSFEQDTVEVYNCYRPGDIVRAVVISLGDARSYYLSTARTDLGVVSARGRADKPMVPLSWELMQCPVTRVKEYRKVAKIDPNEQLAAPAPKSRPAAAAPKAEPQAMQDGTDE